ncbi:MAG: hypothetical protein RJB58_1684 [Pseudomonadota bacterium]|jgi:quinoprotein glucose dehydrogenase
MPGRALPLLVLAFAAAATCALAAGSDWGIYGGTSDGTRYSSLTRITKGNVSQLAPAWTHSMEAGGDPQTHPLAIDGVVYAYTPSLNVIALDGAAGKQIWQFDSGVAGRGAQRGLTWWSEGGEKRLFASVMHYLYALDPATGKPLESFGDKGRIDLRQNLSRDSAGLYVSLTTPGVTYKDTIITGFRTAESAPAAPGDIRAFDVRTGKLRWAFRTIPRPGDDGHDSWPPEAWKSAGGANAWAGMVVDHKRGIVFAPTGSAVDDFYGADRNGNNLYANSLLALDAGSGKRLWHFQGVHHDIFDRDFPAPPVLITVRHQGRMVDAVAQPTKQGFLFVLDRVTGKPLFPIQEMSAPPSTVPGETASPTQPASQIPVPFARQHLTEEMLTGRTPAANAWARSQFRRFHNDGPFAPMRLGQQTIAFPGFDGGAEWGGAAADPKRGIIFINANDIAWTGGLADAATAGGPGAMAYQANCAVCHGQDRSGSPPAFPALTNIGKRMTAHQITDVIHTGRGRMPGFANLQGDTLKALIDFLITGKEETPQREVTGNAPSKYRFTGYRKFLDPDGYPAVAPPWGTLNAIDLNTGKYLWKIALGEYPELSAIGMTGTGSENYGGPILTQSGLLFIGATVYDRKLRAFDANNGKLLWQARLPYAGTATPITYMADGRQFVLIHASNARDKKAPQGSAYIAFALPR